MIEAWLLAKFGKLGAKVAEWLAVLALLSALVFVIHHDGANSARAQCKAATAAVETQRAEAVSAVTASRAGKAIGAMAASVMAQAEIQKRAETRTIEVIRYVQAPPAAVAACALDAAGMRIWTDANADRAAGTGPAVDVDGGMPGSAATHQPVSAATAGEPHPGGDAVLHLPSAPGGSGELGPAPGVK